MSPTPQKPGDSGRRWQAGLRSAGPYLGLGFQLAGTVLFYVVLGYLADRWLGTEPWLLIAGAVLGMVAFFVELVRLVRRLNEESARQAEERRRRREDGTT